MAKPPAQLNQKSDEPDIGKDVVVAHPTLLKI
jgi:hypothetical protein